MPCESWSMEKIIVGMKPRKGSRIKFIQNILIKIYGYEPVYKEVRAKKIEIKASDYPFNNIDGNYEISFQL